MDKITRTLATSTIHYSEVIVENGVPAFKPCPDEIIPMSVGDSEKALSCLKKKYGTAKTFVVTSVEETKAKYEMSLDDFVKYATVVQNKENDEFADSEHTSPEALYDEEPCVTENAEIEVSEPVSVTSLSEATAATVFETAAYHRPDDVV